MCNLPSVPKESAPSLSTLCSSESLVRKGPKSQGGTKAPKAPPFEPREELDEHDDVNDWILLGGGIRNRAKLGPVSMPHPSDTYREMATQQCVKREAEDTEILLHRHVLSAHECRMPVSLGWLRLHMHLAQSCCMSTMRFALGCVCL